MAMDRSNLEDNATERLRLHNLINRLSEEDLQCRLANGWTVAEALAHIAFWDQRALVLIQRWKSQGIGSSSLDVNSVNDALHLICRALPLRAAAQLTIEAAEALDRELEELSPEIHVEIEAAGGTSAVKRAPHRRKHLDSIEQVLQKRSSEETRT